MLITVGPPPIPIYDQPDCPDEGYLWTPGYWAWGTEGYFWVPGTWVMAPAIGLLWTPGYWGWGGRTYVFHEGYWGSHVGFYGGINYGHGYGGYGYGGGRWQGQDFTYNRTVTRVNVQHITHVYSETVTDNNTRIAYNGGEGGVRTVPTPQERTAEQERRSPPTGTQAQHHEEASKNREFLASTNHGKPPVGATVKPIDVSSDRAAPVRAPDGPAKEAPREAKPRELPPQSVIEGKPAQRGQPPALRFNEPAAAHSERPATAAPSQAPRTNGPPAQGPAPKQRNAPGAANPERNPKASRPEDPADPNNPIWLPLPRKK